MWILKKFGIVLASVCCFPTTSPATDPAPAGSPALTFEAPKPSLWEEGVGNGFRPSAQNLTLQAGAAYGFAALGGIQSHDLALLSLSYGHMLGHMVGGDHFYRGNWELRAELFGGAEFAPTSDWIVGLAPHLRYNFAIGTRLVPYIDGGAGVTATSIGPPDLSHTFEFNLQAGLGVRWFLSDNLALTIDAHFLHMSCAGINKPNLGLNGAVGMIGVSWFF